MNSILNPRGIYKSNSYLQSLYNPFIWRQQTSIIVLFVRQTYYEFDGGNKR